MDLASVGMGLLAAGLAACIAVWGTRMGVAAWLGTLTVSALTVAMGLTYGRALMAGRQID